MEKIFKKSLALVLSAALCLTALLGCLTVSAEETATPTYTIGTVEGAPGATVTVPVTLSNLSGVCAHHIKITVPTGLAIDKITDGTGTEFVDAATATDPNDGLDPDASYYSKKPVVGGTLVQFVDFVNWPRTINADGTYEYGTLTDTLTINFVLTIPTGAKAGDVYAIDADTDFADYKAEELFKGKIVNGSVTVKAEETCEHAWEFDSAVPATYDSTGETGKGSITFKCSKCGATKTEEVSYLKTSTLSVPQIGLGSTTELQLRLLAKNYGDSTDGLVQITHTFLNGAEPDVFSKNINEAEIDNGYTWNIPVKTVNFTEEFSTTLFTKRNGAWVSGNLRAFSIQSAAMSVVKGSVEKLKTPAANLLKMGAEAQKAFKYAIDKLADAELTGDYANYVTSTIPTIERNDTNYAPVKNAKANKKVGFKTPTIGLSDSTMLNITAVTTYYEGPKDNLSLKIKYTAYNGADVSKNLPLEELSANNYSVSYGLTAPNLRVPISIQVFNGEVAISDVAIYSIESVLTLTGAEYSELANAMMNYSDSARELK